MIYYWIYSKIIIIQYGLSEYNNIVLLSDDDEELDYYALRHIYDLANRFYLKKIIILSMNKERLPEWVINRDIKINFYKINSKKKKVLERIYRMYGAYIRTIAFDYPNEKMNKTVVGLKGLTKEDVLCYAEFLLFEYNKAPIYEK